MSKGRKGQIAVEYMFLMAFIIIAVTILFIFSFVNYSQNARVAKANQALARMADAVDDVYARGEGNSRFEYISFPNGMTAMDIVHKCVGGGSGSKADCGGTYDDVEFSAITMDVKLLGGTSTLMRKTDAKIEEDPTPLDLDSLESNDLGYEGSAYTVKIYWNSGRIKIEKA